MFELYLPEIKISSIIVDNPLIQSRPHIKKLLETFSCITLHTLRIVNRVQIWTDWRPCCEGRKSRVYM